jgi:hypothetical protein
METLKENTCTLSNDELCNKIDSFITELCITGGKSLSLSVPVNFNRDPDVLISELIKRFKAFELGKAEDKWIDSNVAIPTTSDKVLISDGEIIKTAFMSLDNGKWQVSGFKIKPLFWQPLPALPNSLQQ